VKVRSRKPSIGRPKTASNPLRLDPTRTAGARRALRTELRRRFARLKAELYRLIVEDDVFGLKTGPLSVAGLTGVANTRWQFFPLPEKVRAFRDWLNQRLPSLFPADDPLWPSAVGDAYRKGIGRGYDDARKAGRAPLADPTLLPGRDAAKGQFLLDVMRGEGVGDVLRLLVSRAYEGMAAVLEALKTALMRRLGDLLLRGTGPAAIAAALGNDLDRVGLPRAEAVAHEAVIRPFADGQLDAYRVLGADGVEVIAEYLTAKDDKVCRICGALEGAYLTLDEARGLLPRHPRCRCAWRPRFGPAAEERREQDRPRVAAAIREQLGRLLKPRRRMAATVRNIFCPTGPGGGVDPTCSPGGKPGTDFKKPAVTVKGFRGKGDWKGLVNDLIGHDLDEGTIGAVACAVAGTEVYVYEGRDPGTIDLIVEGEGVEARRTLKKVDGKLVAHNEYFRIQEDSLHKGAGAELFANQVKALRSIGTDRIETEAVGSLAESAPPAEFNGYYTWPRLGYQGTMAAKSYDKFPDALKVKLGNGRQVADLYDLKDMAAAGLSNAEVSETRRLLRANDLASGREPKAYVTLSGADYWRAHGRSVLDGVFDLNDGSRSLKVLDDYLEQRSKKRAATANVQYPAAHPERRRPGAGDQGRFTRASGGGPRARPGSGGGANTTTTSRRAGGRGRFEPSWRPVANAFCPTGKGGGIDPTCSPGRSAGGSSARILALADVGLRSANLTDTQRTAYRRVLGDVLAEMTPEALRRVESGVTAFRYYPDQQTLTDDLRIRGNINLPVGAVAGGAYGRKRQEVYLDGPDTALAKEYCAHELTHAVDGPSGSIHQSPRWQRAWEADIRSGSLTRYATTDPDEGFAEFGRLLYGTRYGRDKGFVRKRFPNAAAVFEDLGLW